MALDIMNQLRCILFLVGSGNLCTAFFARAFSWRSKHAIGIVSLFGSMINLAVAE
jgi:hypothetical protein